MNENKIRAEAITDFAEKLKKYYFNTITGSVTSSLVAYHIEQKLQDELRRLENDEKDSRA